MRIGIGKSRIIILRIRILVEETVNGVFAGVSVETGDCEGCIVLCDLLWDKRDLIFKVASKHGIKNIRFFGSVARREDVPESDLDLLVDFEEGRSLFDLIRFKQEIEDLLNIKVDVVTENSLHWGMKEEVLNGAIQL